ncbi:MAG: DUF1292 domain-containing protein [Oscillospiraceae bacterium]|nr:DUF1292 domain-containing protein [Oscillospiraceae bacterium]
MKIAVTYDNGQIFQHFGHTEYMKIYEIKDNEVIGSEVLSTNGSGHGALAGFLKAQGVDVLICGGIGGGAQMALADADIKLYGGCSGDADTAVKNYLNKTLMYNPNVKCDHHDHDHEHGHDCHCGDHDHDHDHECRHGDCGGADDHRDQMITLTIIDDNGNSQDEEFRVIAVYPAGANRYIALTPDLDAPEFDANIFLFKYLEENGQATVEEIVEDEEFAMAADAFQNWQLTHH